jgi:polyferredoxin
LFGAVLYPQGVKKSASTCAPMAASSGAMLDAHSLNVSYDSQRGEPRGARSR